MFLNHFGIEENPFSNTPDPNYLFMSERHQEALAHLQYGVQGSSGFVLLTGEVGTGKTTICRYLVEQLPENVELAMCLNPRLSEAELLATICDELAIDVSDCAPDSIKDHMDALNRHLLDVHARGRRAVLIIDEAQNLSTPLLEQVRLLTNLETASTKLLQIILVGQPELRDTLGRTELRQLSQRITARYHLEPMNRIEAEHYIRHRLRIGKMKPSTIRPGAMAEIYTRSAGIPRLINSICERSLLGAFALGEFTIDGPLARTAAREVLGDTPPVMAPQPTPRASNKGLVAALSVAFILGSIALDLRYRNAPLSGQTATSPAVTSPSPAAEPRPEKTPPPQPSPPAPEPAPKPVRAIEPPAPPAKPKAAATMAPGHTESDESKVIARLIAAGLVVSAKTAPAKTAAAPITHLVLDTKLAARTPVTKDPEPVAEPAAEPVAEPAAEPVAEPTAEPAAKPGSEEKITLENLFRHSDLKGDIGSAVTRLFSLWNRQLGGLGGLNPCADAEGLGLKCYRNRGTWAKMAAINQPALISLVNADGLRKYAVVSTINGSKATLDIDGREVIAEPESIQPLWSGDFMVLWKPLPRLNRNLKSGMTGKDVAWLRQRLREILGKPSTNGPNNDNEKLGLFDEDLKKQVIAFQQSHNLAADGIVGTMTKIQLSAALAPDSVPALRPRQQ